MGLIPLVDALLSGNPPPSAEDVNEAFWQACHGGQRRTAEFLLERGADIGARPGYAEQSPLQIAESLDTRRQTPAN